MLRVGILSALTLLLVACSGAERPESVCNTPPAPGETDACAYYPGWGWGHVPIYHGSAPGTWG